MLHRLRRAPVLLLTITMTACGLTGEDTPPAPAPAPTQPAAASADEAWMASLQERLARAHAGEEPAPGEPAPAAPGEPEPEPEPAPAPVVPEPEPTPEPEPMPEPAPVAPAPQPKPQPAPVPQEAYEPPQGGVQVMSPAELSTLLSASEAHGRQGDPQQAAIVTGHLHAGLDALARNEPLAAHRHFADAYELDPQDPAARELLARTRPLIEDAAPAPGGEAAPPERAQLLVDEHRRLGDDAMASNDAESAYGHYQEALTLLRANPEITRGTTQEAAMAARVAVARTAIGDRQSEELLALTQDASDLQEDYTQAQLERQQSRVDQLMIQANAAFLADDYVSAEAALDEVLSLQPDHADADNLKRIAQRARHESRNAATRLSYRNQWQDTFDELEHDLVPQNELVIFPDADAWELISERGKRELAGGGMEATAEDDAVNERLQKRIPVHFQDEPLDQVLQHLAGVTGVNILQSQAVQDLGLQQTYTLEDRFDQPVSRILTIVLEDLTVPPLSYTVRDGVVWVITKEEARSDYELQMYDIRDLTFTPKDYAAKDFNLLPSGTDEDSITGGGSDEDPTPYIGPDALLTLIQDNISAESWTSDPNRTIQLMPGTLVVRQTADVHGQIEQLLLDLRANTKTLINIETRFIEVEDSFLEDIGVDLRGLPGDLTGTFPLEDFGQSGAGGFGLPGNPEGIGTGNEPGFYYPGANGDVKGRIENLFDFNLGEPGTLNNSGGLSLQALFLDDTNVNLVLRAVTKYQTSNIVNAPSLMLRSGQRGNVKGLTTRTYLRDFEPEIAQAAVIAQPELANVENGVLLDVRAVSSADRRFITLELRPTVIDLIPDVSGAEIPQKTVSLGTTNSSEVTIELPELRVQRLRTTATIPDGATLMLGGLKRSVEEQQESGVPFLSDIPVLGSLFSRQGEYTSKRKLIILLKASIVVPEEREPVRTAAR